MKSLLVLFSLCFSLIINAKELTADESTAVKKEVMDLLTKFNNGDASDILAKTHSSLIKLMGGQEAFKEIMVGAMASIKQAGVKFDKIELGKPTQLYIAGDEELTFIPQTTIMSLNNKRIKSIGYMIAIRSLDTKKWKFLDGAGMKDNKKLLWQLLPKLPKDVKLPQNTMEILPTK